MQDSTVLVTGATGSFGKRLMKSLVDDDRVSSVIAYSRDELKQFTLMHQMGLPEKVRWVLGDIRDGEHLTRATRGVDLLIHAAALKQVVACEVNPLEAIKTNVLGAANIVTAALQNNVKKVISLSTDKAVSPVNLYGATKLCAEKLITAADSNLKPSGTRFCSVRWGNVLGSRGSVIPFFLQRREQGVLPITDPTMTRFWITLEQTAEFVLRMIDIMEGGEVFIPKVPSMTVLDVATAVAPECRTEVIGIRPGEKLHEVLVQSDEARHCLEYDDGYIVYSELSPVGSYNGLETREVQQDWEYNSGTNDRWMTPEDLRKLLKTTTIERF